MKTLSIDLSAQTLTLRDGGVVLACYLVSTAARGGGEKNGSFQTPRGLHRIRAKIGGDAPLNTVFRGRRPTGEIYSPALAAAAEPGRDWILTRILWLCGCEVGKNRGGDVDTMRRYIYIHGTPDTTELGKPGSIGCVRMANEALIDLFEQVQPGTKVEIF